MTNADHIREFAEICDCPEIQALRGEWEIFDCVLDKYYKDDGEVAIVVEKYQDGSIDIMFGDGTMSNTRQDHPSLVWLPPVSSISHPERSMVGAIGYDIVKIVPLTFGENGTITSWRVGVWCETAHVAAWPEGPTLEIAMAKALKWWLTEGVRIQYYLH